VYVYATDNAGAHYAAWLAVCCRRNAIKRERKLALYSLARRAHQQQPHSLAEIKRDIQKKPVKIIPLRFGRFNWQS
jgi:hypothetical protein